MNDTRQRMLEALLQQGGDGCVSCGACVAGCPVADWNEERLDPRRIVRLIQYGVGDRVAELDWIWHCTTCGRCGYTCPSGIDVSTLVQAARALVPHDRSPGQIQQTADLHCTTGNNMQLTSEQWLETVEWMRDELADDVPDLEVPVDRCGAEHFLTINSKLPMYYPEDLQDIFRLFHAAGVSWTLSSSWWEGTNYAMFTGDEATWEHTLRQQVDRVHQLGCRTMAYTECGHGYYATLTGLQRFGIPHRFRVVHVVSLYAQWIREGRLRLDPSRNPGRFTLHDPCNAVRKAVMAGIPSIAEDARLVLDHVCEEWVEMTPNRDANYCCSGGGGALIAGFKRARTHHGRTKVEQIDRTGAAQVCSPCVNCLDALNNLAQDYQRPWKPVHLWTLLARAIVS